MARSREHDQMCFWYTSCQITHGRQWVERVVVTGDDQGLAGYTRRLVGINVAAESRKTLHRSSPAGENGRTTRPVELLQFSTEALPVRYPALAVGIQLNNCWRRNS